MGYPLTNKLNAVMQKSNCKNNCKECKQKSFFSLFCAQQASFDAETGFVKTKKKMKKK